jgi:hypothetical protein
MFVACPIGNLSKLDPGCELLFINLLSGLKDSKKSSFILLDLSSLLDENTLLNIDVIVSYFCASYELVSSK